MKFRDMFEKILAEEQEGSLKENIAKTIAEKAGGGDLNAIKFLRDMVDDGDNEIPEIKITVIE